MQNFSRLAPFVREYIYEKRWKELRGIQEDAASAILDGSSHVLIASGTASGKTEAAFFPVLTEIARAKTGTPAPAESLDVLYIGPLKALINDQFERLDGLLKEGGIKVWRWHGDVAGRDKEKFLRNPSGILQITPESLEALLLRRPRSIKPVFEKLKFIMIDEVHAFMAGDRGGQLICQILRIEALARCHPRRIGLSATLGDYDGALEWLAKGSPEKALLVKEEKTGRRLRIALDYFDNAAPYYEAMYEQCRDRKCIVFTNSRFEAESAIANLRKTAGYRAAGRQDGAAFHDAFHIHHGSVAAALRTEAERRLKAKEGPVVIAATATLELGLDIGDLDRVIQVGPPLSVSAFVQRLGRSGRRTGSSEIYFTFLENLAMAADALPWALLKTIAVIELYLEEKWIEPPPPRTFPFSLLCHQTLALLYSEAQLPCGTPHGEWNEAAFTRRVLSLPVFAGISSADYRKLLDFLLEGEYIQRTEEGSLIVGLEGELLVNHYSFYSIFPDDTAYKVFEGGKELGTVNFLPEPGGSLTLAGRFWKVEALDRRNRKIFVLPDLSGGEKAWRGSGAETHPRIVRRMREILFEEKTYPYLLPRAGERLFEARRLAKESGLADKGVMPHADGEFLYIPWLGSRAMRCLAAFLEKKENQERLGIDFLYRENEYSFRVSPLPPSFFPELCAIIAETDSPESLLDPDGIPFSGKYDYLLPRELLVKQYAANSLDLPGLKEAFGTM